MSKKLFISTLAALATTGALLSTSVLAAEVTNIKQAYDAVEKAGYKDSNIQSITATRNGYKVKVFDDEDQRVRLMVDPTDGSVTTYEKRRVDGRGEGRSMGDGRGQGRSMGDGRGQGRSMGDGRGQGRGDGGDRQYKGMRQQSNN